MYKILINGLKKSLAMLLPYTCVLCWQRSDKPQDLCSQCLYDLPILLHPCFKCALPLPNKSEVACGNCQRQPPPFEKSYALFSYKPPLTQLLLELKFQHKLVNAKIFSELLEEKIKSEWYVAEALPDIILPVPLHIGRLQERGFNQALEIAKPLAKKLGLFLDTKNCQRVKATAPQMTLSAKQRQLNVRGAFSVKHPLAGQKIAIVEDVITTGSTITELCRVLKQQGAGEIHIWCCARAG